MIQSFADRRTERFFATGRCPAQWRAFERSAASKLMAIDSAVVLSDLRFPPGNGLEALGDDRDGQWSMRIKKQWRVCFVWGDTGPERVEIVDYH
ncbi:MAG: type II toxin-antitoxin system RelE/ParE family toxin [Hyphomicrobiaceae bacterium]